MTEEATLLETSRLNLSKQLCVQSTINQTLIIENQVGGKILILMQPNCDFELEIGHFKKINFYYIKLLFQH